MLLHLVIPMDSKVFGYSIVLSGFNADFVRQTIDSYSRKADSILNMLSNGNFKLGKNLRIPVNLLSLVFISKSR